jgi:hypothetical protein
VTLTPEVRRRDRRVRRILAVAIGILACVAAYALLMAALDTR